MAKENYAERSEQLQVEWRRQMVTLAWTTFSPRCVINLAHERGSLLLLIWFLSMEESHSSREKAKLMSVSGDPSAELEASSHQPFGCSSTIRNTLGKTTLPITKEMENNN